MSHAIFDLELEMPAVTVRKVSVNDNTLWITTCGICSHKSTPRPLISAAVRDQLRHASAHVLTMLRASTERAQAVHGVRVPAPLDAVHLGERVA